MTGWNLASTYAALPPLFFSRVRPTPVGSPSMVVLNELLASALGLDVEELAAQLGIETLAGNRLPNGAVPIAQAYAGHQFGHFTMLGDGRAILLGEQVTQVGERFDVQLKGAGPTPYSRRGDGRGALAPMLREYIISEAMHALGIPTTRSLAVVATGETVWRESALPGAVLARVAQSHIRVGTFQFAAQYGQKGDLKALADYTIDRHYPACRTEDNPYLALLRTTIARQAKLIAQWQAVGFVHGVMNTDNMSIAGETIDYGPCAFMDNYDPKTKFSSIDHHGRYSYGNQPGIALWNLARFAEALLVLFHEDRVQAMEMAQNALGEGVEQFADEWLDIFRRKLGLGNTEPDDDKLINEFLVAMQASGSDFTNTFRALELDEWPESTLGLQPRFNDWLARYAARVERQAGGVASAKIIRLQANPQVIPRNHFVQEALDAAEAGDLAPLTRLHSALAAPYTPNPLHLAFTQPSGRAYRTFCGT